MVFNSGQKISYVFYKYEFVLFLISPSRILDHNIGFEMSLFLYLLCTSEKK